MSTVEDIKSRLDIVDIVSGYVQLKRSGSTYKGLCPFHTEKTPSFVVYDNTQTWRCFGQCGEGGDMFSFIMKVENIDFREALEILAKRAGVTLEQHNSQKSREQSERNERLFGILQESAAFFQQNFPDSPAADYLEQRGLTWETADYFGIGYAPDDWRQLLDHLLMLGYQRQDVIDSGVVIENQEKQSIYDRFRHRFIIPIQDKRGRVVGFGARALADDQNPKYLNSPQTPLFDKSHILFGLKQAHRTIRELEHVVIVEGYMDVIQAHQAGFKNVVATMGTALTADHLQTLSKNAKRIILALDADEAGIKATMRGLEVARETLGDNSTQIRDSNGMLRQAGKLRVDIRVLTIPEGKDPDDFIRQSPELWRGQVARSMPIAEYIIEQAVKGLPDDASVPEREQVAHELLPILTATENNMQSRNNIQLLSMRLKLDVRSMMQWVESQTSKPTHQTTIPAITPTVSPTPSVPLATPPTSKTTKDRQLEHYCLSTMLKDPLRYLEANMLLRDVAPEDVNHATKPIQTVDFTQHDLRVVFQLLQDAYRQDEQEILDFVRQHADEMERQTIDELLPEPLESYVSRTAQLYATEIYSIRKEEQRLPKAKEDEFPFVVLRLRRERLQQEITEMQFLMNEADAQHNTEQVRKYAEYLGELLHARKMIERMMSNLRALKTTS